MFTHRFASRRLVTATAVLGLAATPLALVPASPAAANPAGTGLVINEVYGGGGNSGATWRNDFVELYNPTDAAIAVSGLSVQYRGAGSTSAAEVTPLSGSVPARGTYLVQQAAGTGGTQALPTPDATGTTAMGGGSGTVFLVGDTTAVNPPAGTYAAPPGGAVIDLVGVASNTYEGAGAAPATSNTTSVARTDGRDTDVNSADLVAGTPSPRNAAGQTAPPAGPDPGTPTTATIAQIQGTGAASPLAGRSVTTTGVVTALYRTGGYRGLYLQTGGTGGAGDPTPGASDAVFVYAPADGAIPAGLDLGDSAQVTGQVSEFSGSTQVTVAPGALTELTTALSPVTPAAVAYPTTEGGREAREGELLAPTDELTVTNTYATNQFAEIGLATGDRPLIQPTEVAAPGTAAYDAVVADNAARAVTLDDGASLNFLSAANQGTPLPWLAPGRSVRVGARATLVSPVVLEYRNSAWKLQPRQQVTGTGAGVATFEDTRATNLAPADVGGDLRIGTFNVLNYFNTTGDVFEARGGACTYYNDREGDPVTVNSCTPTGPRGAAELGDFRRQQAKIVRAINTMDADVVSLEEIENSVKLLGETDRDDAVKALVTALNADAGTRRWAYVASPAAADLPPVASQDVIRTAFIYDPAALNPVGPSRVLTGSTAFTNARQPLAQAFKPVGSGPDAAFSVVVNHFKSKGDSTPAATGDNANGPQGAFNGDRVRQAQALATFADTFAADRGTEAVFLTGDFNAYTAEDPVRTLTSAGYTPLESDTPGDYSYSFSGLSGSLDHVFANDAASELVTGTDVWEINANEPIAFQYSRRNYNVTPFFDAADPFAASDHNPEVVGITAPAGEQTELNLLNINDFHGRIDANTTRFATTVEQLRAEGGEEGTLLLSAGDNIGASLFASSLAQDEPTLDVLDALGLRTSAVGNHEFDRGFADLRDRVRSSADFSYLGANVYRAGTQTPVLDPYDLFEVDGVTVAVVGAVTRETPSLVSPGGIEGLAFGDPVEAVNRVTAELTDGIETRTNEEADVVVAEYHEGAGAGTPDGATLEEEVAGGGAFADIVTKTSPAVDAIFTGHTHKQYAWDAPVPGEAGRTRPVLQTGSYGENIGQITLTWDPAAADGEGDVVAHTARNVARSTTEDLTLPRVAAVKRITDAAIARAAVVGNQPVGRIGADITTAYTGTARDNRAAESTLGGTVANALRDGVSGFAEPDLGITNPGGLRAELSYAGDTSGNPLNADGVVTFAEANAVLPFNNTVAVVDLTGAQLKAVLEQQWQPTTNPDGSSNSRPYLQLGLSDNVQVTANPTNPAGSRITSVRLDGVLLDPAATYTVSTLSFLAQGGDNFTAFRAASYVDTGLLDAELWRDYLATGTAEAPITPDFARRQVFSTDLPASLPAGVTTAFTLGVPTGSAGQPTTGTLLDLTSLGSPANTTVEATLLASATATDGTDLGDVAVTSGVARVSLAVPAGAPAGAVVRLVAQPSGTTVTVPVGGVAPPTTPPTPPTTPPTPPGQAASRTTLTLTPQKPRTGQRITMTARVTSAGRAATGTVRFTVPGKGTFTRSLSNGRAKLSFVRYPQPGTKTVRVTYLGNAGTAGSGDVATVRVRR